MIGTALSAISEIVDLGKVIGDAAKNTNPNDVKKIMSALGQVRTIAQGAKDSIMMYPVVFSSSMNDPDLVTKISKYLETQYGLFTLLVLGMEPVLDVGKGSSVKGKMTSVINGFESLDINHYGTENKEFLSLIEKQGLNEEYMRSTESKEEDEAEAARIKELARLESLKASSIDFNKPSMSILNNKSKTEPTVIRIKYALPGGSPLEIPLAIKCNPHVIGPEELESIFASAIENKRPLHRIIRLTTGEIKFFRDFILQMDKIERDKKLYTSLGRHPWYQKLMLKKGKRFASLIAKDYVNKTDILPTCTLICTKDELVSAAKMKYSYILKNRNTLNNIMETLYLLGLGIYDPDLETISFNYLGYEEPFNVPISALKSGENSENKDLYAALSELTKKI